jgi:2-polyprenyl-6-methoxyphenol hydroxylase-like FAD-dependent oxidoreductase
MGPTVGKALELLYGDEDIHFGLLEWVEPPTWGTGRVVLINDAAHSMAPPLALGGAMAIEDAIVLAEELATTDDVGVAIPRFIARREPRRHRIKSLRSRTGGAQKTAGSNDRTTVPPGLVNWRSTSSTPSSLLRVPGQARRASLERPPVGPPSSQRDRPL